MPLQAAPPDTASYMVAGYVVFAVIMIIYLASFIIRRRNLEQDLKTLEGIRAESQVSAAKKPPLVKTVSKPAPNRPSAVRPKPAKKRVTRKR